MQSGKQNRHESRVTQKNTTENKRKRHKMTHCETEVEYTKQTRQNKTKQDGTGRNKAVKTKQTTKKRMMQCRTKQNKTT